MTKRIASSPKLTNAEGLRAARLGGAALIACAAVAGGLLYGLSLAEAGNPDLGDALAILTVYAGTTSLAAALGILYSAAVWPRLGLPWAGVLGPVAAAIGFLSRHVVQVVADAAGLPRPAFNSFAVAALVSAATSLVLYFSVAWIVSHTSSKPAS